VLHIPADPAVAAEIAEIGFVQHDGAGPVQLLALDVAIDERRKIRIGHGGGKPGLDHVECID
jgi:hypothetical protein